MRKGTGSFCSATMESIVGETKEDEIRPGETKDQTVVNDGGTKDQQAVDETTSAEEGEQKAIDETEASSGEASDQKEVDEANPERTGDPKVVDEGKSEEARERDTIDQTTPRETGDQNALDETNPEDAAAGVAARLASIPSDAIWRREIDNTVRSYWRGRSHFLVLVSVHLIRCYIRPSRWKATPRSHFQMEPPTMENGCEMILETESSCLVVYAVESDYCKLHSEYAFLFCY